VVAEAVAVALEAAAAEAAEAVLVTAVAVTEAAGRAADAAESARQARVFAADAAAQSVAHEAARTAARLRTHADLAAAQVQQAARLAADELAQSIADGTALDTGRIAELLAATVSAAADAAAQDTTRAADAVAHAATAAAAQVTQTVAAAEEAAQSEVTATAEAQRELATATAATVALETDARAVGVAMAAREAAAALVTDEHEARTVDREANPVERHLTPRAPQAPAPVGAEETEEILAAAEERDSRAEIRDRVADERELAASLRSFLGDPQYEEYEHAAGFPVRRAAAMDRLDSSADRVSAASDRARLSAHLTPGSLAGDVGWGPHMSEIAAELSHDLRVPLTAIIANVEMLQDELSGHCDQTVAELLGRAMRAGDRMVRMLDQYMASQTPGTPTTMPEIDLAEIVRQLVLDSADLLGPSGAVVETGELPVLRADPDEMYAVLQNLINNSVKFARPGVPALVRISARPTADGWRVSVRDNGVGLGDNSGLDVFSLFSRGTSAVTGHGIGLATVARIVATHGGRVGAAPVKTGAEIWFELPQDETVR
jgi:signal transduction histidine kinase